MGISLGSIKHTYQKLIGKRSSFKADIKCNKVWYGNAYGGFYVNPDLLNSSSIIYSFGIGTDLSFDLSIIANHQSQVFGYDPTPKSIDWIANQQLPTNFHFTPIGLGSKTEVVKFKLPKIKEHVSGSVISHNNVDEQNSVEVQMESFKTIANKNNHSHIDVLKMDIEGSEYAVLDSILNSGISISQILLEIHERFFEDGKQKTDQMLAQLHQHGYKLFGISEKEEELSFIKT